MRATLKSGEDVNLVDCAFLEFGDFSKFFSLNYLDCDFLFGDEVNCLVDLGVDSFSELFFEFVVLDDLTHCNKLCVFKPQSKIINPSGYRVCLLKEIGINAIRYKTLIAEEKTYFIEK